MSTSSDSVYWGPHSNVLDIDYKINIRLNPTEPAIFSPVGFDARFDLKVEDSLILT